MNLLLRAAILAMIVSPIAGPTKAGEFGYPSASGTRLATSSVSGANRAERAQRPNRGDRIDGDGDLNEDGVIDVERGGYWRWEYPYEYYTWVETERVVVETRVEPAAPPPPPPTGSQHMTLPPGCGTVERGGKFLRSCNGVFYEQKFDGDSLVYVVVQ